MAIASWFRCQVEGQFAVAGGDGHVDQSGDVHTDDLADPTFDLLTRLVVPAAEPVAHPLQCVLRFDQCAFARVCDLGGFF